MGIIIKFKEAAETGQTGPAASFLICSCAAILDSLLGLHNNAGFVKKLVVSHLNIINI